ncbi:MAG: hypothetical protein RLZZ292_3336, partial [Bacteroidota bacterium]
FKNASIEDARYYGDGYDFQLKYESKCWLAEVKGVRERNGAIRLTEKEYRQADLYKEDYALIIVSNLWENPKISSIFNPIKHLKLTYEESQRTQITYYSNKISW